MNPQSPHFSGMATATQVIQWAGSTSNPYRARFLRLISSKPVQMLLQTAIVEHGNFRVPW